jgi:hypothetical protein
MKFRLALHNRDLSYEIKITTPKKIMKLIIIQSNIEG